MISLLKFRKMLGALADQMSDEELEKLKTSLYETAQLAFEVYWVNKDGSKNPLGPLTAEAGRSTL